MAPELVLTQGHDKSADYWAFGVLVYEMIVGHTPFESASQQRTFEKIVHSQKNLSFPPDFDPHCKSMIRRLLHPNAALRIGALQNGINDIKHHAFFHMYEMNFEALLKMEVTMPYIPEPYNISSPSHNNSRDIESLNLDFEISIGPEEDVFKDYFENLDDPRLFEYHDDTIA
jgi:serine/threonine protein kinase